MLEHEEKEKDLLNRLSGKKNITKDDKKFFSTFKNLTMMTQLGLNIVLPLTLCLFLGVFLKDKFNLTIAVPIGFILGLIISCIQFVDFAKNVLKQTKGGHKDG